MCTIDIDECVDDNGGCEDICTNTIGSFHCSCEEGFELAKDIFCSGICNCQSSLLSITFQCIDINECSRNTSGCNQTCTNTVGSYYCSCNSGYNLSDNDHDCIGL